MKVFFLWVYAILMMAAGLNHLINPKFYRSFIPNWMPLLTVNYLVGICEFLIGLALLFPKYQHIAALALLIMMICFLPFHLLDVFKEKPFIGSKLLANIRLPIQFVLIWWAWYLFDK